MKVLSLAVHRFSAFLVEKDAPASRWRGALAMRKTHSLGIQRWPLHVAVGAFMDSFMFSPHPIVGTAFLLMSIGQALR